MSIVIVDTNVLYQARRFDGAHIQKVLTGCRRLGIQLYIPDLVADELYGNFKQDLRKGLANMKAETKRLSKWGTPIEAPKIDEAQVLQEYQQLLANVRTKFGVRTAAYPSVSLPQLINATYEGKKPFKASGEGYKDYLIFSTVIECVDETKQDAFFITNNTSDFCDAKGDLHPDLAALVPSGRNVRLWPSFHAFYTDVLDPQLKDLGPLDDPEAILSALKNGTFVGFNLDESLEKILVAELVDKSPTLDIRGPLDEPSPSALLDFTVDTEALQVSKLDDDLLNIDAPGKVEVELYGFMSKSEFVHVHESDIPGVTLDDPDWNDWVVSAYWNTTLGFQLSVIFDQTSQEIDGVSLEVFTPD
jgi:hypothetical protein